MDIAVLENLKLNIFKSLKLSCNKYEESKFKNLISKIESKYIPEPEPDEESIGDLF